MHKPKMEPRAAGYAVLLRRMPVIDAVTGTVQNAEYLAGTVQDRNRHKTGRVCWAGEVRGGFSRYTMYDPKVRWRMRPKLQGVGCLASQGPRKLVPEPRAASLVSQSGNPLMRAQGGRGERPPPPA